MLQQQQQQQQQQSGVGRKAAIILVGYQRDYFANDGALAAVVEHSRDAVVASTVSLLHALRHTDVEFVYTPIRFSKDYSELVDPVGIMKVIQEAGAFRQGEPGSEMIDELKEFGSRIVTIDGKRGFNAFENTNLDSYLRSKGCTDVVLAGAVTSICIDSTGRAAHARGYKVTTLEDCTSSRSDFEQEFYISSILSLYSAVVQSSQLASLCLARQQQAEGQNREVSEEQQQQQQQQPLAQDVSNDRPLQPGVSIPRFPRLQNRTAVILVGYQRDYFDPVIGKLASVVEHSRDEVVSNTVCLLRALHDMDVEFVYTPIRFSKDYSELVEPVGIMKVIQEAGAFRQGEPGSEMIDELKEFGDRIVTVDGKCGFNAFENTCLDSYLRSREVNEIILVGAVTSICIDSTGRGAHARGYKVSVLEDCTSARTEFEKSFFCEKILSLYADVETSSAAIERLSASEDDIVLDALQESRRSNPLQESRRSTRLSSSATIETEGRKALLLMSFQNNCFSPTGALWESLGHSAEAVLERTLSLMRALSSTDVLYVCAPFEVTEHCRIGCVGTSVGGGAFQASEHGCQIIDAFDEFKDRIVLMDGKRAFNAFEGSAGSHLDDILQTHGVSDVILAGAVTSICVDSTARGALSLGYNVTVLSDCTVARSKFEQEYFCSKIFPLFAGVKSSQEVMESLLISETKRLAESLQSTAGCGEISLACRPQKRRCSAPSLHCSSSSTALGRSMASLLFMVVDLLHAWLGRALIWLDCKSDHRAVSAGGDSLSSLRVLPIDARKKSASFESDAIQVQANYRLVAMANELSVKSEELAAARRVKQEFLSYIMHEVRNPMSAIAAGKDNLKDVLSQFELGREHQSELIEILGALDEAVEAASKILDDTLSLHQMEAGKLTLDWHVVDLWPAVIVPALKVFEPKAKAKQITLKTCLPAPENSPEEGQKLAVRVDPHRIMQVVMNLLSNAVKFTPRDGKVVVGVECPTPTEIVVFVEDSGPGIHPDDREKLFQSYVQVYSGKKNEEQGTGLGLAISRRIAEFHDGSMDVTSEIGKGSRFSLTLPRAYVPVEPVTDMDQTPAAPILGRDDCVQDAIQRTSLTPLQAQGQKPCQSPNKSMANWNVMLVEDNCLVRKMTSKMLHNRWGANVVQLSSCDAFLEIVLGVTSSPKLNQVGGVAIPDVCKIDLCLLDNVMPGIMGAEALRLLREHELKSKCERPLRVIMLTGTCLEEERDEFMRLGADYVLTKPLKPKAFETALKALGLQLNCSLYSS